jgi:hypothetical protein
MCFNRIKQKKYTAQNLNPDNLLSPEGREEAVSFTELFKRVCQDIERQCKRRILDGQIVAFARAELIPCRESQKKPQETDSPRLKLISSGWFELRSLPEPELTHHVNGHLLEEGLGGVK